MSARWGFATSSDKGRIEAHVRRAVRLNLYHDTDPTVSQLAEDADDTLFENILVNPQHVLHHLLPSRTQHSYKLRPRRRDCSLTVKSDARNFITRQLFKDMYRYDGWMDSSVYCDILCFMLCHQSSLDQSAFNYEHVLNKNTATAKRSWPAACMTLASCHSTDDDC